MDAVVFDMDGVVVDTEKYWMEVEKKICDEIGCESVETEEIAGMSIGNTYDYLSTNYSISVSEDEFFELYSKRAREIYGEKAELMDGLKQLIADLRKRNLKIGLATGSYWPDQVIKRFDLEFDTVVDSGRVEGQGKPDPETYRLAVRELEVSPEKAVAVEDTDSGLQSAKGAGLYCVGYTESPGQNLMAADETVDSPAELRERLLELAG